jgi:hypothetical protein
MARMRVLVVDDDSTMLNGIRRILTLSGKVLYGRGAMERGACTPELEAPWREPLIFAHFTL